MDNKSEQSTMGRVWDKVHEQVSTPKPPVEATPPQPDTRLPPEEAQLEANLIHKTAASSFEPIIKEAIGASKPEVTNRLITNNKRNFSDLTPSDQQELRAAQKDVLDLISDFTDRQKVDKPTDYHSAIRSADYLRQQDEIHDKSKDQLIELTGLTEKQILQRAVDATKEVTTAIQPIIAGAKETDQAMLSHLISPSSTKALTVDRMLVHEPKLRAIPESLAISLLFAYIATMSGGNK